MANTPKKSSPGKDVIYRRSDNGQFVKSSYVKTHPKTTETEVRTKPAPKKK